MEHQYPGAISGDENMLAELMLPDQAHARKEDWTIFFLHKEASEEEETEPLEHEGNSPENGDGRSGAEGGEDESTRRIESDDVNDGEGPPLIYVLNLVNTKYDSTAKR